MTDGGPGNATRILPLDMYLRGFRAYDMGGASVVGVILVVAGLLVSYGSTACPAPTDGQPAWKGLIMRHRHRTNAGHPSRAARSGWSGCW